MSIKSVVKVMNFHSLLRVDKSREKAKKYLAVETVLMDMIDNIVNNRNIVLDYNTLRVKESMPVLNIYLGSDMGFCANLNTLVNREMEYEDENTKQIIIGRKIRPNDKERILLHLTREEYEQDNTKAMQILEDAIRGLQYSKINIIYNHYYNSTQVELQKKQIFPMVHADRGEEKKNLYKEDFACEGNINRLLEDLMVLYMQYSMEIASATSSAAENMTRQNVTTESLHKIDEREEVAMMHERRATKDKQFAKVLDNFTKIKHY
jgi:F0F1-type ATP synthase gamma subunit